MLTFLVTILTFLKLTNCQCKAGDLDLTFLSKTEVQCPFGSNYAIYYQPCDNNVECSCNNCAYADDYFMALQVQTGFENNVDDCWFLAQKGDVPETKYTKVNGKDAYIVSYVNGLENRRLDVRFFCGKSELDTDSTTCGEETTLTYDLDLYSSNVCNMIKNGGSSGLSAGWIFVICVVSVWFLYCIIGYIINGARSKNWGDVTGNLPNWGMWVTLPKATIAGCIFTVGWCKGKCSKGGDSDATQPLADDEDDA